MSAPPKNEVLVEAGRRGARKRWGPPRIARLDDLTPDQRRLVVALLDAARSVPSNRSDEAAA